MNTTAQSMTYSTQFSAFCAGEVDSIDFFVVISAEGYLNGKQVCTAIRKPRWGKNDKLVVSYKGKRYAIKKMPSAIGCPGVAVIDLYSPLN